MNDALEMVTAIPAALPGYTFVLDKAVRLLYVDDDPIQLEFALVYLSTPTAEVVCANSAPAALKRLATEAFDLVLVDYEMPGMNGVEFIKAMAGDENLRHIPVIMVTSHEGVDTIDAAYFAGGTSFATKPVNWRLLSYQIKFVLRAHALILASQHNG